MGRQTLLVLLSVLATLGVAAAGSSAAVLAINTRLPDWAGWSIFGTGVAVVLATTTWLVVLIVRDHRKPEPKRDADAVGAPATYWTGRPASLGDAFLGRDQPLAAIAEAFETHRAVVISGGAGSGKTRLAAEYSHRAGYSGFWTSAGSDVVQTMGALAQSLGVPTEGRSDDEIAAHVQSRLSTLSDQTLWAIDNLDDLDLVNALMSAAGPVRLLITTRDSRDYLLPNTVTFQPLDVLKSDAAIELLRSRAGERIDPDAPALPEIADAVGHLPLALEMLAVRLARPRQSPERVLEELLTASTPIELAAFEEASGAAIPRPDGVFATISGTLSRLPQDVREQLSGLAYIADRPVPLALFEALSGIDGDEGGTDRVLAECGRESVLELVDGRIVAHALTRAAIAATNAEGVFSTVLTRADARLWSIHILGSPALRDELPHHERVMTEVRRRLNADDTSALNYAAHLAVGFQSAGRPQEAINLGEELLEARIRVQGPEHLDTLTEKSNLAGGYQSAGRNDESVKLIEEVVEGRARALGAEHADTLTSKGNLAIGYHAAGRTEDSVRLNEEVLEARIRVLGPEHSDTLDSKNNLAICYRALGRLEEAIELHREVLEHRAKELGLQHQYTIGTRINLAACYQNAGRTAEAIELNEEVVEDSIRVLGAEHPDTLKTKSNLAVGYRVAGRIPEATRLSEEVLKAMVRVHGTEHPATLTSKSNLANGYWDTGRTEEANALCEEFLPVMARVLGPEHPDTLISKGNLAASYRAAGRTEEAIGLHEEVLEARVRLLGPEHPDTLRSRSNLAVDYRHADRTEEAIGLYEEVLEASARVLGEEHPDTLTTRSNLAVGYRHAGRTEEAIGLHEEVLEARVRVQGLDHPDTLRSRSNLAASYRAAGRHDDANRLMDDAEQSGDDLRSS